MKIQFIKYLKIEGNVDLKYLIPPLKQSAIFIIITYIKISLFLR
mgnify:CR=1 FL=1